MRHLEKALKARGYTLNQLPTPAPFNACRSGELALPKALGVCLNTSAWGLSVIKKKKKKCFLLLNNNKTSDQINLFATQQMTDWGPGAPHLRFHLSGAEFGTWDLAW